MDLLPFEAPPEPDRAPTMDLAGDWHALTTPDAAWIAGGGAAGQAVTMPGELHLQGVSGCRDASIGVRRRVSIPADWVGRTPWLISEGFASRAVFHADGAQIAACTRVFLPLGVALSATPGAETVLTAVLTKDPLADRLASLSRYAAYPVVGLHRPLRLVALSAVHLARLWLDGAWQDGVGSLRVAAVLRGAEHAVLRVTVAGQTHRLDVATSVDVRIAIGSIAPWHAESPMRHDVRVDLLIGGDVVATYTRRIGFRTVAIRDGILCVNGAPVELRGVNRHVSHPLFGRTVDPARERADVVQMRAHHINWIRTSHYPASRALLDACDELGMFVENESPHCWTFHVRQPTWAELDADSQAAASALIGEQCALTAGETVGHACVVALSLANESKWSPAFNHAAARIAAVAPSCPTTFEWTVYCEDDAHACTLAADHYADMAIDRDGLLPAQADVAQFPAIYRQQRAPKLNRPLIIGEAAHLSCYNRAELATDPGIRGDWIDQLDRCLRRFRTVPGWAGLAVWSGVDDRFLIRGRDGEADRWVGYGDWGPFDAWRRPRPEATAVSRVFDPVQVVRSASGVTITNHHDVTRLDGWTIAIDDAAPVALDLAPRAARMWPATAPRRAVIRRADGTIHAKHAWAAAATALPALDFVPAQSDGWRTPRGRIAVDADGRLRLSDADGLLAWGLMPVVHPHQDRRQREQIDDDRCPAVTLPSRDWRVSEVARDGDAIVIRGATADAKIALRLIAAADLTFDLAFTITLTADSDLWEAGICLDLDSAYDRLAWTRIADGVWRDDEPQRPVGSALAWRASSAQRERADLGIAPAWPWSQDQGEAGTHDFASLRRAITSASLIDAAGRGLTIAAAGDLHLRAQQIGGTVRLHLLTYASGGSEQFGIGHHVRHTTRRSGWTTSGRCRIAACAQRGV